MKKFFVLSFILCVTFLLLTCEQSNDIEKKFTDGDLKPAPLAFAFINQGIVYGYTNKSGDTAGTFIAHGGDGNYNYELVTGSGATDNEKFRIEDNKLLIGDDELDWGPYSVRVQIEDSNGKHYVSSCAMEVIITPSPITTAPKLTPRIVNLENNEHKITATWASTTGATGYELYINTEDDAETAVLVTDELNAVTTSDDIETYPGIGTALTQSTSYYVWVKAHNDSGSTDFSPVAVVKTSEPVPEFWYQDSEKGNVIRWDSDTDNYNITATTVSYNFIDSDTGGFTGKGFAYKGTIRHHIKFDPAEAAILQPNTQMGKWGEDLSGGESGVFIIEYDHEINNDHRPGYVKNQNLGHFVGIYYWGAGAAMINPGASSADHPLVEPHIDMKMMYSSNPVLLDRSGGGVSVTGYCETETYEEAIERFTLKDMKNFIAFVATPWYGVFEGMAEVSSSEKCPHHKPITINGKLNDSGLYEYKFINDHHYSRMVSFDISPGNEIDPLKPATPWLSAQTPFRVYDKAHYSPELYPSTLTKTSSKSSVKFAFSGKDDWLTVNNDTGEVVFINSAP
jgi:hypothetical protein